MKTFRLEAILFAAFLVLQLLHAAPSPAAVNVYAKGFYSDTALIINIYTDITTAQGLVSSGVKLNYNPLKLQNPVAVKNEADWYFGQPSDKIPYMQPDISAAGKVVFITGKLDTEAPAQGMTGKVLIGTTTFERIYPGEAITPDIATYFGIGLGLGKEAPYANFVTVKTGTGGGEVLDSSVTFGNAEITRQCTLPDGIFVVPQITATPLSDTDRAFQFDAALSACYERVTCAETPRVCSHEWNFGGSGAVRGGNGSDTMIYQYDTEGQYTVRLNMTEAISSTSSSSTIAVTAKNVVPTLPRADFASVVSGEVVTLTAPILPSVVTRAYIYWGDRKRTISLDPHSDLRDGILHTYALTGRTYNIRIMTIDGEYNKVNYTSDEDPDLLVSIP